ncbi:MAG: DUF3192 domain-containing protein [Kangiellaceae bacterium]|jgi:hypothetical protein|nr:DUF3192 domain-containing protein [Kangiellaceae bacterium]
MINQTKKLLIAASITTLLSGCVITVHDDQWSSDSSWQKRQKRNAEMISNLSLGQSITTIKDELGGADDSEGFESDGKQYIVLFYRTRHERSDSKTTRDETTPLIFVDGKLIGWGQSAYENIR